METGSESYDGRMLLASKSGRGTHVSTDGPAASVPRVAPIEGGRDGHAGSPGVGRASGSRDRLLRRSRRTCRCIAGGSRRLVRVTEVLCLSRSGAALAGPGSAVAGSRPAATGSRAPATRSRAQATRSRAAATCARAAATCARAAATCARAAAAGSGATTAQPESTARNRFVRPTRRGRIGHRRSGQLAGRVREQLHDRRPSG
jgi:hypothetical protein